MKSAVAVSRTSRVAGLALIGLLAWACSGTPAATQQGTAPTAGATPAGPVATAAAPDATPTVATGTPAEPADTPAPAPATPGSTPDVFAVVPASEDASATVELGGMTYLLEARGVTAPQVPICGIDDRFVVVGLVGLVGADPISALLISATHVGVPTDSHPNRFSVLINFPDEQRSERWYPTELVPFNVTGSTATWNGTMRELLGTDREEQVAITIDCAN